MPDRSFYEAAVPDPFTILGLSLKPLSLGHLIILNKFKCPFLTGEDVTFGDLAYAVLICSMTYEDGIAAMNDPAIGDKVMRWATRLTHPNKWLPWKYVPIDVDASSKLFRDYVEYHLKPPMHMTTSDDGKSIGAPLTQLLKIHLLSKLNLTESEIMNRSWSLCLWDLLTIKALEGQVEFIDEDEMAEAQKAANEYMEQMQLIAKDRDNGNGS